MLITVPSSDPVADDDTKLLLTANISGLNSPLNSSASISTSNSMQESTNSDYDLWADNTSEWTLEFWAKGWHLVAENTHSSKIIDLNNSIDNLFHFPEGGNWYENTAYMPAVADPGIFPDGLFTR